MNKLGKVVFGIGVFLAVSMGLNAALVITAMKRVSARRESLSRRVPQADEQATHHIGRGIVSRN